jgi:hypothetical protein
MKTVVQCDQHRRDHDAVVSAQIMAAKAQHHRNALEWARRAKANLIDGDLKIAAAQFVKAVEEMEAAR